MEPLPLPLSLSLIGEHADDASEHFIPRRYGASSVSSLNLEVLANGQALRRARGGFSPPALPRPLLLLPSSLRVPEGLRAALSIWTQLKVKDLG